MQVHDPQGTLHTLAARMVYLARACGPVIARPGPQGEQAPLEAHDDQMHRTLFALLQRPWDTAARRQARESHYSMRRQCLFRLHYCVSWVGLGLCA